jgi:EAL domain-containing protein (putative c-di-GMP-specific phosphodiesterase class I)
VLTELRALGVRVSIDDFGTGYSSLSYLQMLPVDVLKIDRSFVSSTDRSEIIQLIVGLAKTLGLDVVAEGTETEVQVEHVAALGCGYAQGYFFAAPLDATDASSQIGEPFSHPSIAKRVASAFSTRGR